MSDGIGGGSYLILGAAGMGGRDDDASVAPAVVRFLRGVPSGAGR